MIKYLDDLILIYEGLLSSDVDSVRPLARRVFFELSPLSLSYPFDFAVGFLFEVVFPGLDVDKRLPSREEVLSILDALRSFKD